MTNENSRIWRGFDFVLIGVTLILVIYGILMIRSATLGAIDPDLQSRVPRQIEYALVGLVLLFFTAAIDYKLLGSIHQYMYLALVAVLGFVALAGVVGAAGAQRWLTVGIPVQPSELAKMLLIIILAQHLQTQYLKLDRLQTVFISLGYIGLPALFIFLQP
ncbi:MAG TPA: FtsW/RodA/SpoVE family cell cycle protein, partial [Aggregatilineales bacterium]|nr:FtsW/RodA/SpoVE family cell cycle protein [Aggregatilineales bacterium]